ncbi:MAG: biliverdin-producing heme oxygenase [Acidobacteriota bacterium]
MTTSWMLARLKQETRPHHGDADTARLAPLVTPTSVGSYATYLARIFGFEAAVEDALARTPALAVVLAPTCWQRAAWIRDDLLALGLEPPGEASLTRFPRIPAFPSVAHALGWLYVIERNSPLHGIVRRHLARRMPGQIDVASAYLTTTDTLATQRWRALGAVLDEVARDPSSADEAVEAAHVAFRAQQRWLRNTPSPERADRRIA